YCLARGWEVAALYVDDGHSGRNTRRPAYQRMIEERDRWDAILVIKMDRIHRNARNFMEMMDQLGEWEKDFVSATESLDTSTAMGRFVMDIIQRIAQLESEQIGERVKMGMAQKARAGPGIVGYQPPLDRKSTRLNSSHDQISYAVFCLKKKKTTPPPSPHPSPLAAPSTPTLHATPFISPTPQRSLTSYPHTTT